MPLRDFVVVTGKYVKIISGTDKDDREKAKKSIQADGGKWSRKKMSYYFHTGVPDKYKSVKSPAKKKTPAKKPTPAVRRKLFTNEEEEEVEEEEVEEEEVQSPNKASEDDNFVMYEKEYPKPTAKKIKRKSYMNKVKKDRIVEEVEGLPVTASTGHVRKEDIKKFYLEKGYHIQKRAIDLLYQENSPLAVLFTVSIHKYSKATRYEPEKEAGKTITVSSALPAIQIARYVSLDLDETLARKAKRRVEKKGSPQLDTEAKGPSARRKKAKGILDSDDETETLLGFSGNLYAQSMPWLWKYAKVLHVKGYNKMKKDDLIDAILKAKLDDVRAETRARGYSKRTAGVDIGGLFGDQEPLDPDAEIKQEPRYRGKPSSDDEERADDYPESDEPEQDEGLSFI